MARDRHHASWWGDTNMGVTNWISVVLVSVVALVGIGLAFAAVQRTASVELADAPAYTPEPVPTHTNRAPDPIAAFIGDSYTAGANSTATTKRFTSLVAAREGWQEVNLGVGGTGYITNSNQSVEASRIACGRDYCNSYAEQIGSAVDAAPQVIVVSGGRNNSTSDLDELRESVRAFYADLRAAAPDALIFATSPVWDNRTAPESLSEIGDIVRESALAVGGTYLDIGQPLDQRPDLISDDGVHPNDAGHAALASAIEAALDPVAP